MALEQLPLGIVLDIMSLLPVESVMSCKCVCRSWRSLLHLNNRHFARLHLQQQQKQITSRGNQFDFLIKYKPVTGGQEFHFLDYIDHDDHENQVADDVKDDEEHLSTLFGNYRVRKVFHPLVINYHYHDDKRSTPLDCSIGIEGSSDGLVCISCYGDPTFICNPVTREYVNLPRHDYYIRNGTTTSYIVSGFGRYHPQCRNNTDAEYKVVRIHYEDRNIDCKGQVEVYTVGKDCGRWRNRGEISHVLDRGHRGVLVNGTIYWMTKRCSMSGLGIVAFDLAEEKFYEVPAKVPQEWYQYEGPFRIRELGGCLYIIKIISPHLTDVWALKNSTRRNDDGSESAGMSWVKEFTIPENWSFCDPFTLTENGEILAWCNHKNNRQVFLVRYNPKNGNVKRYVEGSCARITNSTWSGAVAHINSFISMKDLGEENAREAAGRHEKVGISLKRNASCLTNKF